MAPKNPALVKGKDKGTFLEYWLSHSIVKPEGLSDTEGVISNSHDVSYLSALIQPLMDPTESIFPKNFYRLLYCVNEFKRKSEGNFSRVTVDVLVEHISKNDKEFVFDGEESGDVLIYNWRPPQ